MDLADASKRLQVTGEIGPAHRDPDTIADLARAHVSAEEAGAAEDGNERLEGDGGHAALTPTVLPAVRRTAIIESWMRRTAAEYMAVHGCTGAEQAL